MDVYNALVNIMEIYFWGMNLRRNDEYLATGKTWTLKALPMIRMMIYAIMILILGDSIDKKDQLWIQKPWPVYESPLSSMVSWKHRARGK